MVPLVVLMFCVFSITTGEFVVAGILPEVAGDLQVSVGTAGLLVTAYAVGMIIGGPVLTAVTAGVDRKRLMVSLLAVAVLGNAISAVAPSFAVLLAARVLAALVTSTFFAQAIVVAVSSAPPERSATMVAWLAFGMNLAMVLGAPIGTVIGGSWGWRATFAAITLACLLGLVLVWLLLPSSRGERRPTALAELRVLRRRPVLLALSVTAVGNVGVLMVFSYLAPLLTDVAGHPGSRLPMLLLVHDREPGWWRAVRPKPAAVSAIPAGAVGCRAGRQLVRRHVRHLDGAGGVGGGIPRLCDHPGHAGAGDGGRCGCPSPGDGGERVRLSTGRGLCRAGRWADRRLGRGPSTHLSGRGRSDDLRAALDAGDGTSAAPQRWW